MGLYLVDGVFGKIQIMMYLGGGRKFDTNGEFSVQSSLKYRVIIKGT